VHIEDRKRRARQEAGDDQAGAAIGVVIDDDELRADMRGDDLGYERIKAGREHLRAEAGAKADYYRVPAISPPALRWAAGWAVWRLGGDFVAEQQQLAERGSVTAKRYMPVI
jgi:hypothetical protein